MYPFAPDSVAVGPPGVLLNDKVDPSCAASEVSVHMLSEPQFGTVQLKTDGSFIYTVRHLVAGPLLLGPHAAHTQVPTVTRASPSAPRLLYKAYDASSDSFCWRSTPPTVLMFQ